MLHLLFDFDGTISDSSEGVVKSIRYAFDKCDVACSESDAELAHIFVGPPLVESLSAYRGVKEKNDCTLVERIIDFFHERYISVGVNETAMYPCCADFLKKCKGIFGISTASSKPVEFVEKLLREYGIYDYFDSISAATLNNETSTKHEIIDNAIEKIKLADKSAKFIMIGDRKYDVIGAAQSGIDCIGVRWGFALPGELEKAGALAIAEDFCGLFDIINDYASGKAKN